MERAVDRLERVAERLERLAAGSSQGPLTPHAPAASIAEITPCTRTAAPSASSASQHVWPGLVSSHLAPLTAITNGLGDEIMAAFAHYKQAFEVRSLGSCPGSCALGKRK